MYYTHIHTSRRSAALLEVLGHPLEFLIGYWQGHGCVFVYNKPTNRPGNFLELLLPETLSTEVCKCSSVIWK